MARTDGLADAGQEVCYWISEVHSFSFIPRSLASVSHKNQRGCLLRVKLSDVCTLSLGSNEVSERSVRLMPHTQSFLFYQLDFTTPGISPLRASERKQRRHTPNLRRKARGRPQSWQRLCWRDLDFWVFWSFTRFAGLYLVLFSFFSSNF